tara:strand:- start:50 stop:214 length:165 start_codon:yes stop_codon:yes gene_type:complete
MATKKAPAKKAAAKKAPAKKAPAKKAAAKKATGTLPPPNSAAHKAMVLRGEIKE